MKPRELNIFLVATLGYGSYGDNLLRAFSGSGHRVMIFNRRRYFPFALSMSSRIVRRLRRKKMLTLFNRDIVKEVQNFRPDLIVVMKGVDLAPETLHRIKEQTPGAILCNVNYDDYFSGTPSNLFPDLKGIIPCYDWFFPSKKNNVLRLKELGAANVRYLPLGYDPCSHFPVRPTRAEYDEYKSQVAFIGTYTADRASSLELLSGYDLSIWGTHWNRKYHGIKLKKAIRNRLACGMDFSRVVNSADININFLREENSDTHNLKTFELPACGGFVISQRSDELGEFFEEGEEIVTFGDLSEMKEKIEYYLRHRVERERIARGAYQRVRRERYTIRDRVETLLSII
jgi:spore maturation protein CgeB